MAPRPQRPEQSRRKRGRHMARRADPGIPGQGRRAPRNGRSAELVLFLGAGVSAGAGLPRWKGLLDVLAKEAAVFQDMRIEEERILKGFNALNPLDRARIISDHLAEKDKDSKKSIGRKVAELIGRHRCYRLSHALLAVLPVAEVVTTNYDALRAGVAVCPGYRPRVLPYQPSKPGSDRWILKLHGCVKEPQDIVPTRADYLRYDERRAALKGIVQAMLITCHMLFVDFPSRTTISTGSSKRSGRP